VTYYLFGNLRYLSVGLIFCIRDCQACNMTNDLFCIRPYVGYVCIMLYVGYIGILYITYVNHSSGLLFSSRSMTG
jgi:hypothetical protein